MVLHIPPGLLLYLTPLPLCILSLWTPPFPLRGPLFSALILTPLLLAQSRPFTQDAGFRFGLMLPWYIYFGTVSKILFSTPERSFWRLGHEREEATKMKKWGWEKFKWSVALTCSLRGVGWNFQVKGLPAPEKEKETKGEFTWRQLKRFLILFLATDLSSLFLRRMHFPPDIEMSSGDLGLGTRFLVLLVMGLQSYCSTSMLYQWFAIFGVLLGVSEPKDWPPIFGPVSRATTLRNFWGSFWHQSLRMILSTFTRFLLTTLHIPRHTPLSSLTTLLSTFTLSGLYHAYGSYSLAYPTPGSLHATTFDRFWRFFIFFELQALGIVVEDVGLRLLGRFRSGKEEEKEKEGEKGRRREWGREWGKGWEKGWGYVWVAGWLLGTGSVLLDAYLKSEMGMVGMQPSFVKHAMKAGSLGGLKYEVSFP